MPVAAERASVLRVSLSKGDSAATTALRDGRAPDRYTQHSTGPFRRTAGTLAASDDVRLGLGRRGRSYVPTTTWTNCSQSKTP